MPSLYERLGGEAAIEAAVARFYDKVMDDPNLAPYFDGYDLAPNTQFDRVVIENARGRRELTKAAFLALPLTERIRCVIERTAKFYAGASEVDRHEALNGLRRAQAIS